MYQWFSGLNRPALEHAVRTTAAATASFAIAAALQLPQAQWAAISTIVVTQSTLETALIISGQRLLGTAIGATAGALLARRLGSTMIAFSVGLLGLGLLCALLRLDRPAYRFAGITLAIIVLVQPVEPAWRMALHRFVEVAVGIAVGLVAAKLWPDRERWVRE